MFQVSFFLSLFGVRRAGPVVQSSAGAQSPRLRAVEVRGAPIAFDERASPSAAATAGSTTSPADRAPLARSFVAPLAVALAACGVLALYRNTAASIVAIWLRSETFAHGFLVIPICLWLVWRRRDALAGIPATPWWPALGGIFAAGALWLVASAADALGVKQFALLFMLQAAIITIIGKKLSKALLFPLAFLLFAVPAGEIFVPTLIDWTADFTIAALRWSGVPVYREANHFTIPSGSWSVVEACSGIRYIIASVMVGTIYAAVAYQSTRRRAAFLLASILVPIVANWLRAYMIVMLAHLTNNKIAVGVDHLIYGWLFFGVVMLILFWVGSFWQETEPAASPAGSERAQAVAVAGSDDTRLFVAAIVAIAVAGLWLPIEGVIARSENVDLPMLHAIEGEHGWMPSNAVVADWKPRYTGYASAMGQTFEKDHHAVGLYLAYFRNQEKGRELITSSNVLVKAFEWNWKQLATSTDSVDWAGARVRARRAEIAGPDVHLEVYLLYWVDGALTSNDYMAKALTAWSRLRGRGTDSALIVIYTRQPSPGENSGKVLRDFTSAMSPSIERSIEAARR
jgi:exosortase A